MNINSPEITEFYDSPEKVIDHVSDFNNLRQRIPERMDNLVEAVSDVKSAMEYGKQVNNKREAIGLSPGGTWFRAASIPVSVLSVIEQIDPGFLKDKKKFYRWLGRHPQYRTGSIKFIG
jgi:hypothetical protein